MKCNNSFNCSGKMVIKCEHTKGSVWVAAHRLPFFAQCSECGWAPEPVQQPHVVKLVMDELVAGEVTKRILPGWGGEPREIYTPVSAVDGMAEAIQRMNDRIDCPEYLKTALKRFKQATWLGP